MSTSSIAIGENHSVDLADDLEIRRCDNDEDYPLALEGETESGLDVSISLTDIDTYNLFLFLNNLYK